MVLFGLAAAADRLRLRRLVKQGNAPPFHVAGRVSRACEQVGIRHAPPIIVTDSLESPALAGWFRPVVLLPAWLVEAGREDALDWALRHELTHLKHRDPIANGVRRLAEILFFFHPAVWWASRNWELAMELACDRALVETEDDVTRYAEQLSVMLTEAHQRRRHALAAGLFATRTQIHARIAALVDNALQVRARLGAVRVSTLVLFACLVFAFGGTAVDRKAIESAVRSDAPVELSPAPEEWGDLPRVDAGLQTYCEQLLEEQAGAIVVMNADTGAVLALASAPYAPFVETIRMQQADGPDTSPRVLPRFHRAYKTDFPPGALFKVVLAAGALEEGILTPESRFTCQGQFQMDGKGRPWHCWKRAGHGALNVEKALAYSCDVFFYNVAMELGIDKLNTWARRMGLGEKTGIALPRELAGLVPDRDWKKTNFSDRDPWDQQWFPGDTMNVSIGQGSMSTTPLQNAVMMATIINGGYRVTPQVDGGSSTRGERLFSDATLEVVHAGLRMSVEKAPPDYPSGTSWRAGVEGIAVLGKTGSAQVVSLAHHEQYEREEDIPYRYRDHAWFVAGVLDREPKVAVCILVEHGMHGSTAASVLAKPVIEYIYGIADPATAPRAETTESPSD